MKLDLEFLINDLCDEERGLREEFLKLFYPKNNGDFGGLDCFKIVAEIDKVSPNSFYSILGNALARSWQISPVLIAAQRVHVRFLIGKAEELVVDDQLKRQWLKRAMSLIRKNFKKHNIHYEY